jgi:hypothetical protein
VKAQNEREYFQLLWESDQASYQYVPITMLAFDPAIIR